MPSTEHIGHSILGAVVLIVIFSFFWPLLAKEGLFSGISFGLMAVIGVAAGWIVIGPAEVGADLLAD